MRADIGLLLEPGGHGQENMQDHLTFVQNGSLLRVVVADGVSRLAGAKQRVEGGYEPLGLLAAKAACMPLVRCDRSLEDALLLANQMLVSAMEELGIDFTCPLECIATSVVAFDLNCDSGEFRWISLGDSTVGLLNADGFEPFNEHPTQDHPLIRERTRLRRGGVHEDAVRRQTHHLIEASFRLANAPKSMGGYGVLNGDPRARDHVQSGEGILGSHEVLIALTDGLEIPSSTLGEDAWDLFAQEFMRVQFATSLGAGLGQVNAFQRELVREDPSGTKYPRDKLRQHKDGIKYGDDKAAVAVQLLP